MKREDAVKILEKHPAYGTSEIVFVGDGKCRYFEKRILKLGEMSQECRAAIDVLVKTFPCGRITIGCEIGRNGCWVPDRLEALVEE